jgi:hypothetical protein
VSIPLCQEHSNAFIGFLRILDTFPGLIFLTTSHPAALDENVKSRVHLNVCFKPLTLSQTRSIFQLNLDRLREEGQQDVGRPDIASLDISDDEVLRFAEEHYNTNVSGRWNGRQICNAVRMAADFARFEVTSGSQPQLKAEHFKAVAEMMRESDEASAGLGSSSPSQMEATEESQRPGSGARGKRMTGSRSRGDGGEAGDDDGLDLSLNLSPQDEDGAQSIAQWSVVA